MNDEIRHALSYPFPIPEHSFLFGDGRFRALNAEEIARDGRVPVLAAGSNQSPEQLSRKYRAIADAGAIPAERGLLFDFDVVYAAHLSGYGSVPATFQASVGTAVTVFVLWLTDRQLTRMHETEGNYYYDRLSGVRVETDLGISLDAAYGYTARNGCLNHGGAPVALSEITAVNRQFREAPQTGAQEIVRDRLAPGLDLGRFVAMTIGDAAERYRRVGILAGDALPPAFERETLLDLGR